MSDKQIKIVMMILLTILIISVALLVAYVVSDIVLDFKWQEHLIKIDFEKNRA